MAVVTQVTARGGSLGLKPFDRPGAPSADEQVHVYSHSKVHAIPSDLCVKSLLRLT